MSHTRIKICYQLRVNLYFVNFKKYKLKQYEVKTLSTVILNGYSGWINNNVIIFSM